MKKKGFTLVELLAVIALLGIVAIIVVPKVLENYRISKKNVFIDEAKIIYNQATEKYLKSRINGNKITNISNDVNSLDLDGNAITYTIRLDKDGNVTAMKLKKDKYCIAGVGNFLEDYDHTQVIELENDSEGYCDGNILMEGEVITLNLKVKSKDRPIINGVSPEVIYLKYDIGWYDKETTKGKTISKLETIPSKVNYYFDGFRLNTNDNKLIDNNGNILLDKKGSIGSNVVLNSATQTTSTAYAILNKKYYNIKLLPNTGVGTQLDLKIEYDESVKIPKNTYTKEGYSFNGWKTTFDESFNDEGNLPNLNDSNENSYPNYKFEYDNVKTINLNAQWKANKYTLTYNANGGNVSPTSKSITYDEAYGDLPNPTRAGYVFQGWYKENTFVNKIESTTIYKTVGNSTIYAKWKECSKGYYCPGDNTEKACAKGTYQDKTGQTSCIDCEAGSYSSGEGAAICIKCAVGSYQANTAQTKCLACTSGKTSVEGGTKCTACLNKENVATWNTTTWSNNVVSSVCSIKSCDTNYHIDSGTCKKDSYTIAFNANSGSGTMNKLTCYNGENCTLSDNAFTRSTYTFDKWNTKKDGSGTSYSNKKVVKDLTTNGKNVTLYAQWRTNYTYITYDISDGTIQPTCILSDGSTGYFKVINGIVNFSNKENGTYSEKFDYPCNRIAYSKQIGPNGVDNYNNVNFINITRTGYKALTGAEWICKSGCPTNKTYDQKDNTYTSNDFCDSKNGDCTVVLKVNWRKGYTVTLDANGGSVSSSSITVYKDMKYGTIPTPTRNNYTFSGWYTAKTGGSKVTSDTIYNYDSNTTIYARWEQKCELYASLSGCDEYGKYIISVTSECAFNSCDGVHKNVKRFEAKIGENEVYNACINWTDGGSASNNVKVSGGNFYRYNSSKGDYVADSNYTVEKMCYSELMTYNKEGIYLYNIVNGRRVIDHTSNEALGNGVSGCYILKVYKTPFVDNGHQYFRIVPGTYYTTSGIGREYIRDGVYIYGGCLTTTNASCANSDTCKNN